MNTKNIVHLMQQCIIVLLYNQTRYVVYFSVVGVGYLADIADKVQMSGNYSNTFIKNTDDQKIIDMLCFSHFIQEHIMLR